MYAFLERVSSPFWEEVRVAMEGWLKHVPIEHRADMSQRLASRDDSQFSGAYLELYLHETFQRLGYDTTIHPHTASGQRPDFLVKGPSGEFFLEARHIVNASDRSRARGNRQSALYDTLQRIDSPNFFLWVLPRVIGQLDPPKRGLVKALEGWLATLDVDEQLQRTERDRSLEDLPEFEWAQDDWLVHFRAIPKSEATRGKAGIRPLGLFGDIEASFIDGSSPLKEALAEKGRRYGVNDRPYVIALGVGAFTGRDNADMANALFGTSQIEFQMGPSASDDYRETRARDGYWYGPQGWAHSHVTGVLQVSDLGPARFASATPTLWLHPRPDHPLVPPPSWDVMNPQADGQVVLEKAPLAPLELFGLTEPWPVGKPFRDDA